VYAALEGLDGVFDIIHPTALTVVVALIENGVVYSVPFPQIEIASQVGTVLSVV
jgi:hypothetical protein